MRGLRVQTSPEQRVSTEPRDYSRRPREQHTVVLFNDDLYHYCFKVDEYKFNLKYYTSDHRIRCICTCTSRIYDVYTVSKVVTGN